MVDWYFQAISKLALLALVHAGKVEKSEVDRVPALLGAPIDRATEEWKPVASLLNFHRQIFWVSLV